MGVELVAVMENPRGCRLEGLRGLEEMLDLKCPRLFEFENDYLWGQLDHRRIEAKMQEMHRAGATGLEIRAYYESARESIRNEKGPTDPIERALVKRQLWFWERDSFDPPDFLILNAPYDLYIEFYPKLLMIKFLWKIGSLDDEFCRKHLAVGRDVGQFFGVDEVLYVTDSAYPSSAICTDFVEEDFEFQKRWLFENLGPPSPRLQAMAIIKGDCRSIDGYYLDRLR